jgi:hypothetical protein
VLAVSMASATHETSRKRIVPRCAFHGNGPLKRIVVSEASDHRVAVSGQILESQPGLQPTASKDTPYPVRG